MVKSMFPHTVSRIVSFRLCKCPGSEVPVSFPGRFTCPDHRESEGNPSIEAMPPNFSTVRSRG